MSLLLFFDIILPIFLGLQIDSCSQAGASKLLTAYAGISKYFIADNKLGRFYAHSLAQTNLRFQVIRVHRAESEVLASYKQIYQQRKRDTDPETFARFMQNNWNRNYYAPSDVSCIQKISAEDWESFDYVDKFAWYIEEVNLQWEAAVLSLPARSYIEVEFSEIIDQTGLKLIEDFIGIPYSRALAKIPEQT